jgi:DNA-binding CsgD family transcriptional regulator
MLAGDDYKRAAGMVEPSDAQRIGPVGGSLLRLGWAMSRVWTVPTPDLAQRLATALMELCDEHGSVMVQLGRRDAMGSWRGEAFGRAGRGGDDRAGQTERPASLPWPGDPPTPAEPVFVVGRPSSGEASFRTVRAAMERVNLELELVAIACPPQRDGLLMTVQVGGRPSVQAGSRAALLKLVLPWAYAIVRAAVGEAPGHHRRDWLTEREQQVLEQLVGGESIVTIAQTLDRSRYTVHDYVKSLHRKLGVRSRGALIGCIAAGVAPPEVLAQPAVHGPGESS